MADLIGRQLGQYTIKELLGEGGMASVYRAWQESMQRDVAIKVIQPRLAQMDEFTRRFEREARTVASLSHAHILKVYEYGQVDNLLFLAMELLKGGSLADVILKGPMSLNEVSRLLDQIAGALDHAHKRGIVHRDLKPQNVLMDEEGDAFLTDFGIAKLIQGTGTILTQSNVAMGTPAYMSPEQWRGNQIDLRADIYALGIMVFEMITGQLPFVSDTPYGLMHQHIYESKPPLLNFRPDLPPGVDKVLNKTLAKEPEQRCQSAGEMAAAFRRAVAGLEPFPDQPPGQPRPDEIPTSTYKAPIPNTSPTPIASATPTYSAGPAAQETLSRGAAIPPGKVPTKPRPSWQIALGAVGFIAIISVSLLLALVIFTKFPQLIAGNPSATPTLTRTATLTDTPIATSTATVNDQDTQIAVALTDAFTQTQIAVASFTATTTPITPTDTLTVTLAPTAAPPNLALKAPVYDPVSQQLTFTFDVQNGDKIAAYTAQIVNLSTNLVVRTYSVQAGNSFAIPVGDLPAGHYELILLPLDAGGKPIGETSKEVFDYAPPTATPLPTFTPSLTPTVIPTETPFPTLAAMASDIPIATAIPIPTTDTSLPVGTSCPDALPSRLAVGGRARVTIGGGPNRLRDAPGTSANQIGKIDPGEAFSVLNGPSCSDQIAWWQVNSTGQVGWTAEGADGQYFVEPLDSPLTFNTNLLGWVATRGSDGTFGSWTDNSNGKIGKYGAGDDFYISTDGGGDFTYEGDILLVNANTDGAAGLAFRLGSNPLNSGYVVNINLSGGGEVKLLKFPPAKLAAFNTPIKQGKSYHLKVITQGSDIRVYFNGSLSPSLEVSDTSYTSGGFGLNIFQGTALYQNIYRHLNN